MEFATKPMRHYPCYLWHVATLPREIKNSNFLQMWNKTQTIAFLIASDFVTYPQLSIFSVFKKASLSPHWFQVIFSMSLFFYFFTLAINLWLGKFVTASDVTSVFVNNQHCIQRRGQNFDKKFVFEGIHSKELNRWISWEKLNKAWW